jgi:hypothetical protein
MFQFNENIKRIKTKTIRWAKGKYANSQEQLGILDEDISNIFKSNMNGIFSE